MASHYSRSLDDAAQYSTPQTDSRRANPASPVPLAPDGSKTDVLDKEVDPVAQTGQERVRAGQGPRSATQLVSGQSRAGSRPTSATRTVESNNKGSRAEFYGGRGGHGGPSPVMGGAGGDGHASELTMPQLEDLLTKFDVYGTQLYFDISK
ncbi:hypothetical protein FB451DRAFT_719485 [Mycena latifolia]|nr:hypothetical protein FB451DRAFT_719485 [Mycena latifolia]